jgi:hypothetical protein
MLQAIDVDTAEKVIRRTAASDIRSIRRIIDQGSHGWMLGYYQGLLTGLQNEANTLKLSRTEETLNRIGNILIAARC